MRSTESPANFEKAVALDRELVRAVIQRDRKATADFVEAHSDAVYTYVSRRVFPRKEVAEDLTQEVFLSALENLAQFQGNSGLRSWLMGIARHKVQDYFRERLREGLTDEPEFEPLVEFPVEDWLHDRHLAEKVRSILSLLPEAYRCGLLWKYWEKCSTAEMAFRTGKTEKAMERLLARAREEFRRRWNDE